MSKAIQLINDYLDHEIATIPCRKTKEKDGSWTGKKAAVQRWSDYCHRLPTEEEVEQWSSHQNIWGLGIVTGEASNICCVDVDYNDEEMQKKIDKVLPYTPCRIAGKRGYKYLYRLYDVPQSFTPPMKWKERIGEKKSGIDILRGNAYICIPPGLHSEVEGISHYYEWVDHDLLNIGKEALPILEEEHVEAIRLTIKNLPVERELPKGTVEHEEDRGRWQHITGQASKLIADKTPIEEAISQLVKFDEDNFPHNPYFLDKSKGCMTPSPIVNATKFYGDMLSMANRGKADEVPPLKIEMAKTEGGWGEVQDFQAGDLPEFDTSLIPEILRDTVLTASDATGVSPQMFYFYFLGTLSACCGNRIMAQPYQKNREYVESANLYTLLVAKSGERKTQVSKIAKGPLVKLNIALSKASKEKRMEADIINNGLEKKINLLKNEYADTVAQGQPDLEIVEQIRDTEKQFVQVGDASVYEQQTTAEKLYQIAEANQTGIFVEINEWGATYDKLLQREMQNYRQFVMDAWDGTTPFKYATKRNGQVYIDKLCLSIGASCQEDVLQNIMSRVVQYQRENDGLIQRFMIISGGDKSFDVIDSVFKLPESINEIYYRLYYREAQDERLLFSMEATEEWMKYQKAIREKQKDLSSVGQSFLSKQVGLVVRMSSLLAQIQGHKIITGELYAQAEKIMDWVESSSMKYVNHGDNWQEEELIKMLRMRAIDNDTSIRDLYRLNQRFFGKGLDTALVVLEKLHKRNIIKVYRDGKSNKIRINPNL